MGVGSLHVLRYVYYGYVACHGAHIGEIEFGTAIFAEKIAGCTRSPLCYALLVCDDMASVLVRCDVHTGVAVDLLRRSGAVVILGDVERSLGGSCGRRRKWRIRRRAVSRDISRSIGGRRVRRRARSLQRRRGGIRRGARCG